MTYLTKGQPSYRKAIFALFSGSFVSFMILYSVQTLFPIFSKEFVITPATSSLSLSISTGFLAVTMLIASNFSDSIGKKQIMVVSLILTSLLSILASFSPNFTTLLIIRALQGIALAGFPSIAMSYVSEEFHPKILGVVMGIHVSGNTLGGLAGRFLTSLLTDWFSWHIALFTLGMIGLVFSIWFWRTLPIPKNSSRQKQSIASLIPSIVYQLKDGKLLCLFGLSFVLMGSFVTVYNYLGYLLLSPPFQLSQTFIGLIFFIYLVGTFSSTFMGRMSDSVGKTKVLLFSIITMLAGACLTLSQNLIFVIIALCIFTFGFFGCHSIASRWVGELARKYKTQATSLYLFCYYLGSSIIGTSGGLLWNYYNWGGVVMMVSLFIIIALALVTILLYQTNQIATSSEKRRVMHQ